MKKRIPDYIFNIFLTMAFAVIFLYFCSLNTYVLGYGYIFLTVTYFIIAIGLGVGLLFFIMYDFQKIQHYRKTKSENNGV